MTNLQSRGNQVQGNEMKTANVIISKFLKNSLSIKGQERKTSSKNQKFTVNLQKEQEERKKQNVILT